MRLWRLRIGLAAFLVLGACAGPRMLVYPPTIYAGGYPAVSVPVQQQTALTSIMFATDRLPEGDGYGSDRSQALAFGNVSIAFETESWDSLVTASGGTGKPRIPIRITDVTETGRFPATPLPFTVRDGHPIDLPGPRADYKESIRAFKSELSRRLSSAAERELIIFVHGFNNDFDAAALSTAELWHYTGRQSVPLIYTWPAGHGGFKGYFTDRESGEFTVYHLKEVLRHAARVPDLERIHLIAHSRGTDVATTALRELVIEARAAGQSPRKTLKIENLILAAPDLDFGVVGQRLIAEQFGTAFGRITVYTNKKDGALGIAQFLMQGQRFGRLQTDALTEDERQIFTNVRNVHFINVPQADGFFGHAYYRETPEVLSDIAIIIRERANPGAPERPLTHLRLNFWEVPDGYPTATGRKGQTSDLSRDTALGTLDLNTSRTQRVVSKL